MPVLFQDCSPAERLTVQRIVRSFLDNPDSDSARMDFGQSAYRMYRGACDEIRANIAVFNDADDIAMFNQASAAQGKDLLRHESSVQNLHQKFFKAAKNHKKLREVLGNAADEFQLYMIAGIEIGAKLISVAKETGSVADRERRDEFEAAYRIMRKYATGIPESLEHAKLSQMALNAAAGNVLQLADKISRMKSELGPSPQG